MAVANAVLAPEQDSEVIESGIEEYQQEVPGLTLGMYVDISIFIRVGKGEWNNITKTSEPMEIIIGIPEHLQENGREYYIIRAHEGEYTFMDDMDDERETITICTDMFSSYAIAYQQTSGTETSGKCSLCHLCPTFLGICYFIWLAVLVSATLLILWIVIRRNKKKDKLQ